MNAVIFTDMSTVCSREPMPPSPYKHILNFHPITRVPNIPPPARGYFHSTVKGHGPMKITAQDPSRFVV